MSIDDLGAVGTLASSEVHDIAIEFDQAEFEAMVETYNATGDKEWIERNRHDRRRDLRAGRAPAEGQLVAARRHRRRRPGRRIPWLVKLDEFVDDQNHDGLDEFVIRSNSSMTALNEAVALELLDLAGLASQDAIATASPSTAASRCCAS